MSRMYSRKHGKSGSKRPLRTKAPKWIRYKKDEVEKLVIKFAKEEKSSSQIGIILRDQYGIPNVKEIVGKSITKIMKENKIYPRYPEDMLNLMRKALKIREHLSVHKHDPFAIRGLELTESKIRRLGKYYKKKEILPDDWKYDPNKLRLITG
ncbi:MAG: 30S ribosomal protein S15 [Candidatus Aenigmarchaeota archaeon]|nr:30S ribosomal protein S15 [Candidatus Aenigmarchaeota archaeon]